MLSEHKMEVLRAVEASGLPVRKVLGQLEIPRSTYYRWRHSFRQRGLAGLRVRPLEAEGLIREVELRSFPAELEYRIKTTRMN